MGSRGCSSLSLMGVCSLNLVPSRSQRGLLLTNIRHIIHVPILAGVHMRHMYLQRLIFSRTLCKTRNKRQEKDISRQGHPVITLFEGSSNFKISDTDINVVGGNATIIRFGDGQFTELQRNLVCCTYTS
ncbi:hypothetical protein M378DRAFT_655149 [Amanita muscaria Koide BX008]|uniref:Uncharacterized protein n=1 Tax=Amanita muscaria (strain Koide BX008) TaxID=946122 RepID=A0A0C2SKG0_AMAMK|nr:hypothetical protein M378DRAFT_655149 [Amanita muscaria Koide BX008]